MVDNILHNRRAYITTVLAPGNIRVPLATVSYMASMQGSAQNNFRDEDYDETVATTFDKVR